MRDRRWWHKLDWGLPLAFGLFAFLWLLGPRILDPRNLAWVQGSDQSTYFLGWLFFRQSDWSFPLGLNPDYGLEFANSIVYSDSLPLLAFLFKPFDAWLPQSFQYEGWWLLACFLLQAFFAWKLTGLLTGSRLLRLLACGLFVFSPPMLSRLWGHWTLVGHFLLLAALYLALRPTLERRCLAWALLLCAAALVHAYFLVMVLLIWLGDLAGRTQRAAIPAGAAGRELVGHLALVVLVCWQAGYFSVGKGVHGGEYYGLYQANLLTLFDPGGWSFVLRDLPEREGHYEGFNFLGLGVIVLAVAALGFLPRVFPALRSSIGKRPFLLLALLLLAAFAFSHKPSLGTLQASVPLPELLLRVAEIFRASGRMLWPAFYALLFLILFLVLRGGSPRTAACLLTLALVVQIADTRAGWRAMRDHFMAERSSELVSAPPSPFWEEAAGRYRKLRHLPPANQGPLWRPMAWFAGTHGMATDAAYLARVDPIAFAAAEAQAAEMLQRGSFADDSLYVLDATVVEQARLSMDPQRDLLQEVDGVMVLAPGWYETASGWPF